MPGSPVLKLPREGSPSALKSLWLSGAQKAAWFFQEHCTVGVETLFCKSGPLSLDRRARWESHRVTIGHLWSCHFQHRSDLGTKLVHKASQSLVLKIAEQDGRRQGGVLLAWPRARLAGEP